MAEHSEQRLLAYSQAQMFDLVADIDKYPEFLPWCVGARIRRREGNEVVADLAIGFKMYRERFTSHVVLTRPDRIHVTYSDGPFRYLNNEWRFTPTEDGGCLIDFYVDFEFKSKLLQHVIEMLFNEAVKRMVAAFEARARKLYGEAKQP
jgi:coenzyme Q-binding protein COQ10